MIFDFIAEETQPLSQREQNFILDVITFSIRNAATEFKTMQDQQNANVQENLNRVKLTLQNSLGRVSSEAVLKNQMLKTLFERVEDDAIFTLDQNGNIISYDACCQGKSQLVQPTKW